MIEACPDTRIITELLALRFRRPRRTSPKLLYSFPRSSA
jgi:hypothetical protein